MSLITAQHRKQLILNGVAAARDRAFDPKPVVRLVAPWIATEWFLTESATDDPDLCFGVTLVAGRNPELVFVSLAHLESLTGPGVERVEVDAAFVADKTLAELVLDALYRDPNGRN
jgi:hypothetical protein